MAKKSQLEYYWDTVYKIALKELDIDENKLISIKKFLDYVGLKSNELKSKSIEVNRDTWTASVALSDIEYKNGSNEATDLVSSHITSGERIGVLETTSAMETIDYGNIEGNEVSNDINRSIVSKTNKDLDINNMDIDSRIKLKLRNYREITDNQSHRDLIDRILKKEPLTEPQKEDFYTRWADMLRKGIGINKQELSRILEDDNYKDILHPVQRDELLYIAQNQFDRIELNQKDDYARANNRRMHKLNYNMYEKYKRDGWFNDWNDGVVGKFKGSGNKLFTTVDNKLQLNEDAFNELVSELDLGTDEESKKIIKNMVGDLKNTINDLASDNYSRNPTTLIGEAVDRVFGTYGIRNDLKSVDKAEEALIMKAIKDKGLRSTFKDEATKTSFSNKLSKLDESEGNIELGKYLRFDGDRVSIANGLNEEETKKAEELKKVYEDYNSKNYKELVQIARAMDSIANSHDTASIINNYYMTSNGEIHLADTTTNEF